MLKTMIAAMVLATVGASGLACAQNGQGENESTAEYHARLAEADAREAKARAEKAEAEAREVKARVEKAEAEAREAKTKADQAEPNDQ